MGLTFTATEKLEAVERELKYRHRVYNRMILDNKMNREFANRQIGVFEAIAEDYREWAKKERLL